MRFIEVSSGDRIVCPRRYGRRDLSLPLQWPCHGGLRLIRLEFLKYKVKRLFLPVNSSDSDAVHSFEKAVTQFTFGRAAQFGKFA
jgi:hypothetical protein